MKKKQENQENDEQNLSDTNLSDAQIQECWRQIVYNLDPHGFKCNDEEDGLKNPNELLLDHDFLVKNRSWFF